MTMTMAEAGAAIGDAVSAAIAEEFTRDQQQWLGDVPPPPAIVDASSAAGHDASKVPAVPQAQLTVDHNSPCPSAIFTWKAESGAPPHVWAQVPPHWLRDVVRPGYAVIDHHLVLQILTRQADDRPSQILAMVVGGYFDSSKHDWRSHGRAMPCTVAWALADPGNPLNAPYLVEWTAERDRLRVRLLAAETNVED